MSRGIGNYEHAVDSRWFTRRRNKQILLGGHCAVEILEHPDYLQTSIRQDLHQDDGKARLAFPSALVLVQGLMVSTSTYG